MKNLFEALMADPDFRDQQENRERARVAEAHEILARFGSVDALLEETTAEAALRAACESMVRKRHVIGGAIDTLLGWTGGASSLPEPVRRAVSDALPIPADVAGVWAEFAAMDQLDRERATVETYWTMAIHVDARRVVLEALLDGYPAKSLDDLRARLSWLEYRTEHDLGVDLAQVGQLRADIETFATHAGVS